ncbi:hypothetical protein ABW19_dt0200328 [Dactylella cylindrospora]|nr:hypothetical protein ABW19_dt0200328 [Dactylella cylindrospora]
MPGSEGNQNNFKIVSPDRINTKRDYKTDDDWAPYEGLLKDAHRGGSTRSEIEKMLASKDFKVSQRQIKHRLEVLKLDPTDRRCRRGRKALKPRKVLKRSCKVVGRGGDPPSALFGRKSSATDLPRSPMQNIIDLESPLFNFDSSIGLENVLDEKLNFLSSTFLTSSQNFLISAITSYKETKRRILAAQERPESGKPVGDVNSCDEDLMLPEWDDSSGRVVERGYVEDSDSDGDGDGNEDGDEDGDEDEDEDGYEELDESEDEDKDKQICENLVAALDVIHIDRGGYSIGSQNLEHHILLAAELLSGVESKISRREYGLQSFTTFNEMPRYNFGEINHCLFEGDHYGVLCGIEFFCRCILPLPNAPPYLLVLVFEACWLLMEVVHNRSMKDVICKLCQVGMRCLSLSVRLGGLPLLLYESNLVVQFIRYAFDCPVEVKMGLIELVFLLLLELEGSIDSSSIRGIRRRLELLSSLLCLYGCEFSGDFQSPEFIEVAYYTAHQWDTLISMKEYTVNLDDIEHLFWICNVTLKVVEQGRGLLERFTSKVRETFGNPLDAGRGKSGWDADLRVLSYTCQLGSIYNSAGNPKLAITAFQDLFYFASRTPLALVGFAANLQFAELELCQAMLDRGPVLYEYVRPILQKHECPSCFAGNSCHGVSRIKSRYDAYVLWKRASRVSRRKATRPRTPTPRRGVGTASVIDELAQKERLNPTAHDITVNKGVNSATMVISAANSATAISIRSPGNSILRAASPYFQVPSPGGITMGNAYAAQWLFVASMYIDTNDSDFEKLVKEIQDMDMGDHISCSIHSMEDPLSLGTNNCN